MPPKRVSNTKKQEILRKFKSLNVSKESLEKNINEISNLSEAKIFLKKLSKIVLILLKTANLSR